MPSRRYPDNIPEAWPRGMRDQVAAAYVGLSLTTFLREVAGGRAPAPRWPTKGRRVWLRDDLDRWLDNLPAARLDGEAGKRMPAPEPEPAAPEAKPGQEWLQRVRGDDDRPALSAPVPRARSTL